MSRSAILNVMVGAAMKAGRSLVRDFGEIENLQVSRKGPADFVSAADRKAENIVRTELMKARPGYSFLGEEGGEIAGDDSQHRWIVDPLDGTTNFLHGVPIFAVSMALERQGTLVAGVVFNPIMNELYVAERGGGAFLNDRRLRVSARTAIDDCLIGTGLPFLGHGDHGRALFELRHIMNEVAGIRRCGAASLDLCWTASGRYDGFWEHNLKPWDMAAGILIVKEAGGFVSDGDGRDRMLGTGSIVAGNEDIQRGLLGLLKKARQAAV